MATQVTATLVAGLTASAQSAQGSTANSLLGSNQFSPPLNALINAALTNGTGAGKVNQFWADYRTLASTSEDINVYTPATLDACGNALTIATVKMLIIVNNSDTEANTLTIGGKGTTAGWTSVLGTNTDTVKIPGGGSFVYVSPGATGAVVGASTTNHLLTITNAASFAYTIIIVGATA